MTSRDYGHVPTIQIPTFSFKEVTDMSIDDSEAIRNYAIAVGIFIGGIWALWRWVITEIWKYVHEEPDLDGQVSIHQIAEGNDDLWSELAAHLAAAGDDHRFDAIGAWRNRTRRTSRSAARRARRDDITRYRSSLGFCQ